MDPRESFISSVVVSEARVRPYAGFVFLCGGKTDVGFTPVLSVRHRLCLELSGGRGRDIAGRIKLAEDITDWYRGGVYRDLVTFETDLAALASVIVLIVESPGAIAELGVFTVVPEISSKLVLVVEEGHFAGDSYIKLGPVTKFEVESETKALVHPWLNRNAAGVESFDPSAIEGEIAAIADEVKSRARVSVSEAIFNSATPQHVMLMIVELCSLFGALTETELSKYLEAFGVSLPLVRVRQFLWLLARCGMLMEKARSNGRYYAAPDLPSPLISFRMSPGYVFNRERLKADVAEYYREKMSSRFAVLRSIASSSRAVA